MLALIDDVRCVGILLTSQRNRGREIFVGGLLTASSSVSCDIAVKLGAVALSPIPQHGDVLRRRRACVPVAPTHHGRYLVTTADREQSDGGGPGGSRHTGRDRPYVPTRHRFIERRERQRVVCVLVDRMTVLPHLAKHRFGIEARCCREYLADGRSPSARAVFNEAAQLVEPD